MIKNPNIIDLQVVITDSHESDIISHEFIRLRVL